MHEADLAPLVRFYRDGRADGGFEDGIGLALERLPSRLLARTMGSLPRHAVSWPTAGWRLEVACHGTEEIGRRMPIFRRIAIGARYGAPVAWIA